MTPILVIALEFGPVQTTGAFRSIDMVRYLPDFGFVPHVLTIEPKAGTEIFGAFINEAMLSNLPDIVKIHHIHPEYKPKKRGSLGELFRIFTSLDDTFYKRFRASLITQVNLLQELHDFAAVYVSAPPFGAARLGELASSVLGKPYLLDMRDAWSEWSMAPYPTYLHYQTRLSDERRAFARASAIVTVTDRMADVFRHTHPDIQGSRFHVVYNGFDGPLLQSKAITEVGNSELINIAYVGSFYYTPKKPRSLRRPHSLLQYERGTEDWSYRSPLYFFQAWQELNRVDPQVAARLRFHHVGSAPSWLMEMAEKHGLAQWTKLHGFIPKQEVGPVLEGMQALLATSMKRDEGGDYCLASKTFDYILARKPIVAFVTEGSQRDFLDPCGMAVVCDPDDKQLSASKLKEIVMGKKRFQMNIDYVNTFHRKKRARKMAGILRKISM